MDNANVGIYGEHRGCVYTIGIYTVFFVLRVLFKVFGMGLFGCSGVSVWAVHGFDRSVPMSPNCTSKHSGVGNRGRTKPMQMRHPWLSCIFSVHPCTEISMGCQSVKRCDVLDIVQTGRNHAQG